MNDSLIAGTGDRLARLMGSALFGEVVKRLERGVHISPEDGDSYYFVSRHFDDLAAYFRHAFKSELVDRGWFHLEGHPDYYGKRQLAECDIVTGTALALAFHSPERLKAGGLLFEDFVDGIKSLLGGEDAFVAVYRPRAKKSSSPEKRMALAEEDCRGSIRKLARLGFAKLAQGSLGRLVDPREPCHRFADVVKLAAGTGDDDLAAAFGQLAATGRFCDASTPDAEGDLSTEDSDAV